MNNTFTVRCPRLGLRHVIATAKRTASGFEVVEIREEGTNKNVTARTKKDAHDFENILEILSEKLASIETEAA